MTGWSAAIAGVIHPAPLRRDGLEEAAAPTSKADMPTIRRGSPLDERQHEDDQDEPAEGVAEVAVGVERIGIVEDAQPGEEDRDAQRTRRTAQLRSLAHAAQ